MLRIQFGFIWSRQGNILESDRYDLYRFVAYRITELQIYTDTGGRLNV